MYRAKARGSTLEVQPAVALRGPGDPGIGDGRAPTAGEFHLVYQPLEIPAAAGAAWKRCCAGAVGCTATYPRSVHAAGRAQRPELSAGNLDPTQVCTAGPLTASGGRQQPLSPALADSGPARTHRPHHGRICVDQSRLSLEVSRRSGRAYFLTPTSGPERAQRPQVCA